MRIVGLVSISMLTLVAACTRTAPTPVAPVPANTHELGTFTGYFDPTTRTVRITVPSTPGGVGEMLAVIDPWSDGSAGTGPDNTLEIVTDTEPAPATILEGCGPGVDAFSGSIRLRSFFPVQTFANVYVQILNISPIGREACNSDSPGVTGLDGTKGLWRYGSLGVKGSETSTVAKEWRFKLPDNTRFTFTGRILADVVTVANPNAEFDWNPILTAWAPNRFDDTAGTTLAHLVWNGSSFVDSKSLLTFSPVGDDGPTTVVGLWAPPQSRVGPFTSGVYYVASAASGGANLVDTRGDFTACVKFKPGVHPGSGPSKVLFGLGQAEGSGTVGWALMQMHSEYCFHYQTGSDPVNTMAYSYSGLPDPSAYAYDYVCGGRNGSVIQSASHGDTLSSTTEVNPSMVGGSNLPYVIGAYPDGSGAGTDQGVYEAIIDSRPFTGAVAAEIVAAAEGRRMVDGATYHPAFVNSTLVTGIDGLPYLLPPNASVPVSTDGSGLLDQGKVVYYRPVLQTSSASTGFCVAVEAKASGPWASVQGGMFDWGGGQAFLYLWGNGTGTARSSTLAAFDVPGGWAAGSRHTLALCVATNGTLSVYGDGTLLNSVQGATVYDLADPSATMSIGTGGYPLVALSNARIGRVLACPGSNPASCH